MHLALPALGSLSGGVHSPDLGWLFVIDVSVYVSAWSARGRAFHWKRHHPVPQVHSRLTPTVGDGTTNFIQENTPQPHLW